MERLNRSSPSDTVVRIGAVGAARITEPALIEPSAHAAGVVVAGIATRYADRAKRYAATWGVERAFGSYEDLIDSDDIDAVYVALPNSEHAKWAIAALRAGKHVLIEKPAAANADEARALAGVAAGYPDLVAMEAFHWLYHPLARRMFDALDAGEVGHPVDIRAWMRFPLLRPRDIRWRFDLAGGALMDVGCYTTSALQRLAGPGLEVESAHLWRSSRLVDRRIVARLSRPYGPTATIDASMLSTMLFGQGLNIEGSNGRMTARNPFTPHRRATLEIRGPARRLTLRYPPRPTSYDYQLAAFAGAIRGTHQVLSTMDQTVGNLRLIDAIYRAAALPQRPGAYDETRHEPPA